MAPPRVLPTGSPLDAWKGGLPEGGHAHLMGAPSSGKTTFLAALARSLKKQGMKPLVIVPHMGPIMHHLLEEGFPVFQLDTILEVAHTLKMRAAEEVLLLDDMPLFLSGEPEKASTAASRSRAWAHVLPSIRQRAVITTSHVYQIPFDGRLGIRAMPRTLAHISHLVFELVRVAEVPEKRGAVMEARAHKFRCVEGEESSSIPPPLQFWMSNFC